MLICVMPFLSRKSVVSCSNFSFSSSCLLFSFSFMQQQPIKINDHLVILSSSIRISLESWLASWVARILFLLSSRKRMALLFRSFACSWSARFTMSITFFIEMFLISYHLKCLQGSPRRGSLIESAYTCPPSRSARTQFDGRS